MIQNIGLGIVTLHSFGPVVLDQTTSREYLDQDLLQRLENQDAVPIVERMFPKYCEGDISRKDILHELQKKAGLTEAGSATYFQIIKNRILEDEEN